jgi:hypothetical protein
VDTADHTVDVYIAHDQQPKPLVILIHGSGCAPLMTVDPDGSLHDTSLFQDLVVPRVSRFHFAMVDKRGVTPLRFPAGATREVETTAFERASRQCSAEYLQNVTKHGRVADVSAALRALERQPWVREILVVGHSEGTHVVTGLLREIGASRLAAAGLFASAGPIPFFGGYAGGPPTRERLRSVFDRIRMLQRASDDAMDEGLPVRRWKTFWLESTPIEDVASSIVPLFIAQGTRDGSTLSADLFTLEAIRQQPNRALRYVAVEGGDHAFQMPDGTSRLDPLFDDFVQWSLDAHRQTDVAALR